MNLLYLLLFCLIQVCYSKIFDINNEDKNGEQKYVLKETVKVLLDFDNVPTTEEKFPKRKISTYSSRYMLALFDSSRQSPMSNAGYNESNVIRSINPSLGSRLVKVKNAISFSLNTLKKNEQLVKAQLFLYQKNANRKNYKSIPIINVVDNTGSKNRIEGIKQENNLLVFDIKSEIQKKLNENVDEISVLFERNNQDIRLYQLMKTYSPFLLIFTESTDFVEKFTNNESADETFNEPTGSEKKSIENNEITTRFKRNSEYTLYDEKPRNRDPIHEYVDKFRETGPNILRRKNGLKRNKNRRIKNDPMMGFGQEGDDNKNGYTQNSFEYASLLHDNSLTHDISSVHLLDGSQYHNERCGKKLMKINFSEIGWGSKVIAPKVFHANYCAGSCSFPLNRDVNPSNHAIFQSLMHSIIPNAQVPGVCCAPETMESLSILYFDETDNVVLKTYPKMIVKSCSCL